VLDLFQKGFRLGTCSIDPKSARIERLDGVSHVSPKAMEVLLCLVDRAGRLVGREELIHAGWGNDEAVREEALTRCVAELRNALGDDHHHPEYIQTVPRRGYRIIAPVNVEPEATPVPGFWGELKRRDVVRTSLAYGAFAWLSIEVASQVGSIFDLPTELLRVLVVIAVIGFPIVVSLSWAIQRTPEGLALDMPVAEGAPPLSKISARRVDYTIIVVLLVAISFLLYREFQPDSGPGGSAFSVAVLPFDNLSGHTEDEYMSDGLAEELLNLLAQTEDLDVTSRKASFYYKNKDVPLAEIVGALDVRNIVEGSVQREGEIVRFTIQLVDSESLMHRWSDTYDTTADDLLWVRDTVAREVAAELKTAITERGETMIAKDANIDRRAYMLYLRARGELRKEHSSETLASAERFLKEALSVDSDFPRAWAGLCDCYLARYIQSGSEVPWYEKGEEACRKALALDAGSPEAFTALGNLYRISGNHAESLTEFAQALTIAPNHYDAIHGLALTLQAQSNLEGAESQLRKLTRIEPGYWHGYNALGHFLYANSRYDEAADNFRRVTALDPDNSLALNNLGAARYMLGDYAGAAAAWEESVAIRASHLVLSNVGLAAYYAGDFDKAADMQTRAIVEAPEDYRIWGRLGDAERHRGMVAAADAAYGEAIRFASRAVELNASNEEALRYLSLYYSHTGDSSAAISAIERARQLQPEASRIHYFASKVYLAVGDVDRAILELDTALEKGYSRQIIDADPDLAPLRDALLPDTRAALRAARYT